MSSRQLRRKLIEKEKEEKKSKCMISEEKIKESSSEEDYCSDVKRVSYYLLERNVSDEEENPTKSPAVSSPSISDSVGFLSTEEKRKLKEDDKTVKGKNAIKNKKRKKRGITKEEGSNQGNEAEEFERIVEDFLNEGVRKEEKSKNNSNEERSSGMDDDWTSSCAEFCLKMKKQSFLFSYYLQRTLNSGFQGERTTEKEQSKRKNLVRNHVRQRKFWLLEEESAFANCVDCSIAMKQDDDEDTNQKDETEENVQNVPKRKKSFFFCRSSTFYEIEKKFERNFHSNDFESLHSLLSVYPLHIPALLRAVETLIWADQLHSAFSLVKQAIYSFQCAFHLKFSPFLLDNYNLPHVSLSASKRENLFFFKTLGIYMILLEHQSCYRISFECAKLLICCDPSFDVFHALLHIDFYAFKSKYFLQLYEISCFYIQHLSCFVKYSFFGEISEKECHSSCFDCSGKKTNLHSFLPLELLLPNFAYTVALAKYTEEGNVNFSSIKEITLKDLVFIMEVDLFHALKALEKENKKEKSKEYTKEDKPKYEKTESKECCKITHSFYNENQTQNVAIKEKLVHMLLMRSLLLYPSFIQSLLLKINIKVSAKCDSSVYSETCWGDAVFNDFLYMRSLHLSAFNNKTAGKSKKERIFSFFSKEKNSEISKEHEHECSNYGSLHRKIYEEHKNMIEKLTFCYLEKTNHLYNNKTILSWIHSCICHISFLFKETNHNEADFSALYILRNKIRKIHLCSHYFIKKNHYCDVILNEFYVSSSYTPPAVFDGEYGIINEKYSKTNQETFFNYIFWNRNARNRAQPHRGNLSLKTNVFIVFFFSVLPFMDVDYSGFSASPLYISDIYELTHNKTAEYFSLFRKCFHFILHSLKEHLFKFKVQIISKYF